MLLVDETLVGDIARSNKKIARLALKAGLQDIDSNISDFLRKGVSREELFREASRFSEETENDDIV